MTFSKRTVRIMEVFALVVWLVGMGTVVAVHSGAWKTAKKAPPAAVDDVIPEEGAYDPSTGAGRVLGAFPLDTGVVCREVGLENVYIHCLICERPGVEEALAVSCFGAR